MAIGMLISWIMRCLVVLLAIFVLLVIFVVLVLVRFFAWFGAHMAPFFCCALRL